MTFSFRIHREHGAFAASAICIGDVVPVRARGRLSTCTKTPQNEVHAPALFASVPLLPLPPARQLVARSRQQVLRLLLSRPFSSVVVIGNTLRRLASVLLLRQSQPPHGLALAQALNWCGLPTTRRSVFSRFQPSKQSKRGLSNRFQSILCLLALVHSKDSSEGTLKCAPKEFLKPEKEIPRMT